MKLDKEAMRVAIKAEIVRLAALLDADASDLEPDELIPASGYIDSAGLLELIAWFESTYQLQVSQQDFTIDNLGTIDAMAQFARQRKGAA
jgi:D-alanine--poly(phosphoribitol) ligase subunit 2